MPQIHRFINFFIQTCLNEKLLISELFSAELNCFNLQKKIK